MPRKSRLGATVKKLQIAVAVLAVVIVVLAAYIIYPIIQLSIRGQPFGQRLTGIDQPLTPAQLSVINNASNNDFEIAGEMLLNGSIQGEQVSNSTFTGPLFEASLQHPVQESALVINGKPSVVYIGAISCIYCGESRWAMAMALSRFGAFKNLYVGYSSFGDGDLPTLYWIPQNYTTKGLARFGNEYDSNYINFYSAEYDSPITQGFQLPASTNPIQYFVANATNSSYLKAMQFMNGTHAFQGTPFTFWGTSLNLGATGVVFGNGTSQTAISNNLPLTYMSHQQLITLLKNFNSTFAYEEYAAADIYVAQVCPAINNSAQVCSLPAIRAYESKMGLE